MKLWIAREKCGALFIYSTKPYKSQKSHVFKVDDGIFMGVLDDPEFLNVTFENSPMEVELKLVNNDKNVSNEE